MKNKTLLIIILSIIVVFIITAIVLTGVIINKAINDNHERENTLNEEKEAAIEEFDNRIAYRSTNNYTYHNSTNEISYIDNTTDHNSLTLNDTAGWKATIKDLTVEGRIEIPKTQLDIAVLDKVTMEALKDAVGIVYGPGVNEVGNTIIMGNSNNENDFFFDNQKIELGDEIFLTDIETHTKIKYVVYNKYIASSTSFDYASRDTGGKREITLISSVNDNNRLIIWAKEEQ